MSDYVDPFAGFDPNDSERAQWATYSPHRRNGMFKVHAKRGFALNALTAHTPCALYERVNGRLVERMRYDRHNPEPVQCEHCFQWDAPAYLHVWNGGSSTWKGRGRWGIGRLPNGNIDYANLRLAWTHEYDYATQKCRV